MPVLVTCQIKSEGDNVETCFFFFFFFFFFVCLFFFSHYKSMGAFCCHGNHSFDDICSKILKHTFPHPTDATYRIWSRLADWSWRLYNKSIEKFNPHSRARNSEATDPIKPEFELVWDFMPILVTSKFDESPIKNECASLETPFSHYFWSNPIWPKFELRDVMSIRITCTFDKERIKTEGVSLETSFSPL